MKLEYGNLFKNEGNFKNCLQNSIYLM